MKDLSIPGKDSKPIKITHQSAVQWRAVGKPGWGKLLNAFGSRLVGLGGFAVVAAALEISIMPMMIFAMVGAGAIAIPAALKLLAWENEVEHDGFEWVRVQLISTDRSRNLVMLQRRYDPDIPFEQNYLCFRVFLPKHRIDEFLDSCKVHAPSNVEFEEGKNIF